MAHWGTYVNFTHKEVLLAPWGNFFTTYGGLSLCLGPAGESFCDTIPYWGFG